MYVSSSKILHLHLLTSCQVFLFSFLYSAISETQNPSCSNRLNFLARQLSSLDRSMKLATGSAFYFYISHSVLHCLLSLVLIFCDLIKCNCRAAVLLQCSNFSLHMFLWSYHTNFRLCDNIMKLMLCSLWLMKRIVLHHFSFVARIQKIPICDFMSILNDLWIFLELQEWMCLLIYSLVEVTV